jgi:hypothetical protein
MVVEEVEEVCFVFLCGWDGRGVTGRMWEKGLLYERTERQFVS